MAYQIKDESVLRQLKHLARVRGKTVADVLREAVGHETEREASKAKTADLLRPLRSRIRAMGEHRPVDWSDLKRRNDEDWGEPV